MTSGSNCYFFLAPHTHFSIDLMYTPYWIRYPHMPPQTISTMIASEISCYSHFLEKCMSINTIIPMKCPRQTKKQCSIVIIISDRQILFSFTINVPGTSYKRIKYCCSWREALSLYISFLYYYPPCFLTATFTALVNIDARRRSVHSICRAFYNIFCRHHI